jgi:formylglycine-generating enzyme required for sulfatase activity
MPGNTEGSPAIPYTFRAEHTPIEGPIEYRWDFDTTQLQTSRPEVEYTFESTGWYHVTVLLLRQQQPIGRGSLLVNVRTDPPEIPMVAIGAGSFLRGSTRGDFLEQPVVRVTLSLPLLVGIYEVTQAEWERVMGTSPSYNRGDRLPVENISWMDAIDFCNRLSIRHGLVPCYHIRGDTVSCDWNATGYRLPTEAEWEYCARAGTTTDVFTGNIGQPLGECSPTDTLDPVLDRIAWYCKNSDYQTHPVGLKEPNPWGLYDIIGNVAEFVWDWSDGRPYSSSDTLDPRGPVTGAIRRIRGGSFLDGARQCRAAARQYASSPTRPKFFVGFRLVRRASQ